MKHPTLFDVPQDSPTRAQRMKAFKDEHGIETLYTRGVPEPWLACHMPSARKLGTEYGLEPSANLGELMAHLCRLLDDAYFIVTGTTECESVEKICICNLLPLPRL